jgi:hypothetical protein
MTKNEILLPKEVVPCTKGQLLTLSRVMSYLSDKKPGRKSRKLDLYDQNVARFFRSEGHNTHDVAAAFQVNQGRISELMKKN